MNALELFYIHVDYHVTLKKQGTIVFKWNGELCYLKSVVVK